MKPDILKDIRSDPNLKNLLYKIGNNPDIGVDSLGNIVLKNVKTGEQIVSNLKLEWYYHSKRR